MVESTLDQFANMSIIDCFAALEKRCACYNDYINCEQDHFKMTLDAFEALVKRVQSEALFSKNESLKDLDTDHIKLLLIPALEADVLYRIMDDRLNKVK